MAQSEPRPPRGNRPPSGNGNGTGDPNFNWRGFVLFAIALALIGGALFMGKDSPMAKSRDVSYPQLIQWLEKEQIAKDKGLELVSEPGNPIDFVRGYVKAGVKPDSTLTPYKEGDVIEPFKTLVNLQFDPKLKETLDQYGVPVTLKSDNNLFASALFSLLPIMLFLLILYFFFRQQIRMAGKGALNFGKSKARMLSRDKNKVTFKDVAGVEEAKDEVQEIVEFLRDPKKFQKLGGRIPKGVLMVGPPGTGKTLLARAIAGEADVPFFSISGSDFVEMFVGVGASRVRDMFEQGKKAAPCIIFIDEIDAVGRHRGHGLGGGHDEREQTLNALLVEMDGFDTQEGVIIIAATNRPDVLDPALLRPGRFDRQITVALPDVKGREEILRVHSKKVKISEDVDLSVIARGTPGYSGAELANVINEAALIAARKGAKAIGRADLEEARDKVRWGRERRSLAMSETEKISTAWHEAGHAILSVLLEHTDPLHKVTIIPRGRSLGSTMSLPEGDQYSFSRKKALDSLAMTAAGRIAEELYTHDISTGAAMDIRQMSRLARKMVCEWGMSDKIGMVEYGEHEDYVFLGRDLGQGRDYSEATAQEIDREVKRLCDDGYARAKELLMQHRANVEAIAKALLEFETLDGSQIREIVQHGRMLNPPPGIAPKGPSAEPPPLVRETRESDPGFPPGLTQQPA
jgi:cell division protease FtsH